VVAPKPMWDAESATTKQVEMGGSLTTPTAPQRTDVNPNRCGEPVNPLKGTLAPFGGQSSGDVSNSELTFSTAEIPRLESLVKENSACNFLETNGNAGFE